MTMPATGIHYRQRDHVIAVRLPAMPDVALEVEVRGLARQLGMAPVAASGREILLTRDGQAAICVPRGHWFVVHPRSGSPLFEVLSDEAFSAAFDGPVDSIDSQHVLMAAVAAEAHWQLGRQVELCYLERNDFTTGQWAHPGMQAVIADIRTQLRDRDAELWEPVEPGERLRWDHNRAVLPVQVQVRPQLGQRGGYHPGSTRHAVPIIDVHGNRHHAAGRALCETSSRPVPMPVGPVTIAPPDCPRCMTHLRDIATRHGCTLEEPSPPPQPPKDESDRVGADLPSFAVDLPDLGEGWRLVQFGDSDRWWLHHADRIRGYIHRYTNQSGNKTGWEAFQFVGHGRYRHLDATSAAQHRPNSSFLWRSIALAAWGIATSPSYYTANPAWTHNWRMPRSNTVKG